MQRTVGRSDIVGVVATVVSHKAGNVNTVEEVEE